MNPTRHPLSPVGAPWLITGVALLALAGCSREAGTGPTAGQQVDATIAKVEQTADAAAAKASQALAQAEASTDKLANQAGERLDKAASTVATKVEGATDAVANQVSDARITVSVNAELAKDPTLSALRINVDTVGGRVQLKGSAPSSLARDRAGQLAGGVQGVTSVENQLDVKS